MTDGKNQVTTWNYDEYGRATNKVDATSTEIFRYRFDPNGRLTNRWTAAKGNTVYRYDLLGNLTNVDYAVSPDLTMQYDALNRLTNLVDAVGTNVYTYDAASQLLSEDGPWASDTVTYTYAQRLRTSLTLQQPTGSWTNGYRYDVAKRLTNITSQAGAFGYAYEATRPALVSKLTLPNTAYITNTYDAMTRLLSTKLLSSSSQLLNAHSYSYNLINQRTALTNTAGDYRNYTYDNLGQLKTALGYENDASPRHNERLGYTYDAAGNLNYRTNNAFVQTFPHPLSTKSRQGQVFHTARSYCDQWDKTCPRLKTKCRGGRCCWMARRAARCRAGWGMPSQCLIEIPLLRTFLAGCLVGAEDCDWVSSAELASRSGKRLPTGKAARWRGSV